MQKSKGIVRRLGNAVFSQQPVASVERSLDHSLLLENVREGPIGHHVYKAITLAGCARQPRTHINRIGDFGFVLITRVELTPDQGKTGGARSEDLVVNFTDSAANHFVPRNVLVGAKDVLRCVIGVDVAGDEVHWNVLLSAVCDESVD